MSDPRSYPDRPFLAVSAAIFRDGKVLIVQRARSPGRGIYTLPGGGVELGETLEEAALRELREETGLGCTLGPVVEVLDRVVRDGDGRVEYHYVILDFLGSAPVGELRAGSDSADARWVPVAELDAWETTDGLAPVIRRAVAMRDGGERGPWRQTER